MVVIVANNCLEGNDGIYEVEVAGKMMMMVRAKE